MQAEELKAAIVAGIAGATVQVIDLTGNGSSFEARVVSDKFVGKNRIAQHRMVYDTLGDAMHDRVHALRLITSVPEAGAQSG